MIVGKIWGGLGNQLFQYAYFYSIQQKTNQELKLDISFYGQQKLRSYRLGLLNIKYQEITSQDEIPIIIETLKRKWPNRLMRLFPFYLCNFAGNWRYYKENRFKHLGYADKPKGDNIYLDGYWQTEKYFSSFENELREQFKPKYAMNDLVLEKIKEVSNCASVSVHIRRGDYLSISKFNPYLYLLKESYYRNAIQEMKNRVNRPIFFFFSDDIEWVKNVFHDECYQYININTSTNDIDELMIMSNCKHHITANSSYSWWGAWLNPRKDKIVIAPKKIYGNYDILPSDWIKVNI